MVISEILGAVCFIFMAALPLPAVLLVLRVAASLIAAPFVPASSAALPGLVGPKEPLAPANAKLATAGISGGLIGGLLAAALLVISAPEAVFLVNAVTFIASAALIISINADFRPADISSEHGRVSIVAAGFRYLGHHHLLRPVTLAYGIIFIGVGVTGPAEMVISSDFGAGAAGFAILSFIFALGGIVGARLTSRGVVQSSVGPFTVLAVASGVLAAGFLVIGFAPDFGIVLAGMAVAGGAYGMWRVAHENIVQRMTPDAIRSRVFAAGEAVEQAGIAIGLLGAGVLISTHGAAAAFRVGSVGSVAAFLLLVMTRSKSLATLSFAARFRRRALAAAYKSVTSLAPASEPWARQPAKRAGWTQ